jgi:hypothetical protein
VSAGLLLAVRHRPVQPRELSSATAEADAVVLAAWVAIRWRSRLGGELPGPQKTPVNGPETVLPSDCNVIVKVPSMLKQPFLPVGSKVGP